MIIHQPQRLTTLDIWAPRYHDQKDGDGEWVALLAKYKVDQASPVILIDFTKAKHLKGQRFCIERKKAQSFKLEPNTKTPCYAVPMSAFESWDSAAEIRDVALGLWDD